MGNGKGKTNSGVEDGVGVFLKRAEEVGGSGDADGIVGGIVRVSSFNHRSLVIKQNNKKNRGKIRVKKIKEAVAVYHPRRLRHSSLPWLIIRDQ